MSAWALLAALVAAGCGGSSGGDETTTPAISKAEFVKKANALCTEGAEKLHTEFLAFSKEKQSNPTSSSVEGEEYIDRVIAPSLTREIAELRALGIPNGDEERLGTLFAAVQEGVQSARENPESLVTANAEMFGKAIRLATAYGLTACAQSY